MGLKLPWISFHRSDKKNLLKCFEQRRIIWYQLKNALREIHRGDIVHKVGEVYNIGTGNFIW